MTKRDLGFDDEDICRKLEIIPGLHLYITEINSKHQSSFLFSLKVELMLLLAILNRLKSFRWFFSCLQIIEFTGWWICCNMLAWNTAINLIDMKKVSFWPSTGKPLNYICNHYYKMISEGNGTLVAYTPCLKCHVHSKLTGLRRVYLAIGSVVCIIKLLIAFASLCMHSSFASLEGSCSCLTDICTFRYAARCLWELSKSSHTWKNHLNTTCT